MTHTHIASAFDRDLEAIQAHVMRMGGLVEAAILDAAEALETRDEELAHHDHAIGEAIGIRLDLSHVVAFAHVAE